jgi:hypothetical protein
MLASAGSPLDEAAGMPVGSLVQKLVWRLDDEVADEMLDLQQRERGEDELNVLGHDLRLSDVGRVIMWGSFRIYQTRIRAIFPAP